MEGAEKRLLQQAQPFGVTPEHEIVTDVPNGVAPDAWARYVKWRVGPRRPGEVEERQGVQRPPDYLPHDWEQTVGCWLSRNVMYEYQIIINKFISLIFRIII